MAKHLKISGRVQGVGFRYSMRDEAERLGVTGWVRNRRDGTVEAVIDGAPEAVEAVFAWGRRGPRRAQVNEVEGSEISEGFQRLGLRPTEEGQNREKPGRPAAPAPSPPPYLVA